MSTSIIVNQKESGINPPKIITGYGPLCSYDNTVHYIHVIKQSDIYIYI